MKSLAPLVALILIASACTKGPPPTAKTSGGDRSAPSQTLKRAAPNWGAMIGKVRNLDQRRDKIISLMQDAVSEFDHYKRSEKSGSPDKKRLESAKNYKLEAGDLYDGLREDVTRAAGGEDRGDQLWEKRLRAFQTKFDKLSKKVRRIEFR